jgi:putative AdoMet-dependent methyltransferase
VVDVGTGTGNLAQRGLALGYRVAGIDPSPEMRRRAAAIPGLEVHEGTFLNLPLPAGCAGAVISSYAFHHLTDAEKISAGAEFARVLDPHGRVILADTAYRDLPAKATIHEAARRAGFTHLLHDLETEYYATLEVLERALVGNGFRVRFEQLNKFVWLLVGEKRA